MKPFLFRSRKYSPRTGFSLVEATFSLGLMSFGFLILAPLLAVGLKTARHAQDERLSAQVAQTLIEEARQGTLAAGTAYLDLEGVPCPSTQAVYKTQTILAPLTGNGSLTRLTLQVTPVGAPDRVRTYAVVFPSPF